jgi:hypothetical protein
MAEAAARLGRPFAAEAVVEAALEAAAVGSPWRHDERRDAAATHPHLEVPAAPEPAVATPAVSPDAHSQGVASGADAQLVARDTTAAGADGEPPTAEVPDADERPDAAPTTSGPDAAAGEAVSDAGVEVPASADGTSAVEAPGL